MQTTVTYLPTCTYTYIHTYNGTTEMYVCVCTATPIIPALALLPDAAPPVTGRTICARWRFINNVYAITHAERIDVYVRVYVHVYIRNLGYT